MTDEGVFIVGVITGAFLYLGVKILLGVGRMIVLGLTP